MRLNEGMRAGDLDDLVLPLISVDEYDSMIDPKAVSIGFYVHDQGAADDLNRFFQKSPVPILSSEVSPAPDQHGYYIVFIELMPDENIGRNLEDILGEAEGLCGIDKWKMRIRTFDKLVPFTVENFNKSLKQARLEDKKAPASLEEAILEFLVPSVLENAVFRNGDIILETASNRAVFRMVDFDTIENVTIRHNLNETAVKLNLHSVARAYRLETMLGEGWSVSEVGDFTIIQHTGSSQCLVIQGNA